MIDNTKESLNISFINGDRIGKCSGCIDRYGSRWAEADQVIYMSSSQMNRVLGEVRESYCYYDATKLIDKIKDTVEKKYSEDLRGRQ